MAEASKHSATVAEARRSRSIALSSLLIISTWLLASISGTRSRSPLAPSSAPGSLPLRPARVHGVGEAAELELIPQDPPRFLSLGDARDNRQHRRVLDEHVACHFCRLFVYAELTQAAFPVSPDTFHVPRLPMFLVPFTP